MSFGRSTKLASSLSVSVDQFSDSVRAPRNCLEGIWSKAAELLRTEGAIVPAPGTVMEIAPIGRQWESALIV